MSDLSAFRNFVNHARPLLERYSSRPDARQASQAQQLEALYENAKDMQAVMVVLHMAAQRQDQFSRDLLKNMP